MDPHSDAAKLSEMGIDTSQFNVADKTLNGAPYFRSMPEEELSSLEERPDMHSIPFWEDQVYPDYADSYMIQSVINNQLSWSKVFGKH